MFMNAAVVSANVRESGFFDQMTGEKKPGWSVEMVVLDLDTSEKYTVELSEGLPRLDELKEARRMNRPADELAEMASHLQDDLPAPLSQIPLEVLKVKGKSAAFLKLVCRVARAAVTA
jgi:hypothetical protein